jgi:hypothetical protein
MPHCKCNKPLFHPPDLTSIGVRWQHRATNRIARRRLLSCQDLAHQLRAKAKVEPRIAVPLITALDDGATRA